MPFHIYILSNKPRGTLYIGMTGKLVQRIYEHKNKITKGFSSKYHLNKLVYTEEFDNPHDTIAREKQLKNWHRDWKIKLIESINPNWDDLYKGLF